MYFTIAVRRLFNEAMVPWLQRDFNRQQANENPLPVPNHAHAYDFDDVGHPPEECVKKFLKIACDKKEHLRQ